MKKLICGFACCAITPCAPTATAMAAATPHVTCFTVILLFDQLFIRPDRYRNAFDRSTPGVLSYVGPVAFRLPDVGWPRPSHGYAA
jgi:hypothetical protein